MADYIEREAVYQALADQFLWDDIPLARYDACLAEIGDIPAADVVEVVRCKDCRWGREACGNIECLADTNVPPEYHGYDWFCPNGERKDG